MLPTVFAVARLVILMLRVAPGEGRAQARRGMVLFPGMEISRAVFAFNTFGDSLRDALDPTLRPP